jgi:hypothetical protein
MLNISELAIDFVSVEIEGTTFFVWVQLMEQGRWDLHVAKYVPNYSLHDNEVVFRNIFKGKSIETADMDAISALVIDLARLYTGVYNA